MEPRAFLTAAIQRAVLACALLVTSVLGARYATCVPAEPDCEHAVRDASDGIAVVLCTREYHRTGDPATGARLANSLRRSGNTIAATALANQLVATPARAEALRILGKIAVAERRFADARKLLESARELHAIDRRIDQLAVDDQALANVYYRQDRYAEALRALDACITESRQAHDAINEGYCHMSAGHVLGEAGYFDGAQAELDRAEPLLTAHRDLGDLAAERGALYQLHEFGPFHRDYNAQAVLEFQAAIAHARIADRPQSVLVDELDLVYSLAEVGRLDEASQHLDEARRLDADGHTAAIRTMLEGRIAFHRGDLVRAAELGNRIFDQLDDNDEKLNVAVMQARIALVAGDPRLAETWASRGIDVIEQRRAAQPVLEMRPWVLSIHRQPYELLFVARVRSGHLADAVVAFDQWHGRTLLDASSSRGAQPTALQTVALQTETLRRLVPVWAAAPIMRTLERDVLMARLATTDLIALVIAEHEVWRIAVRAGAIAIVDIGPLAALEPRLAAFEAKPTDAALAEALGDTLLGGAAFRETGDTLHVVLDGRLARIPVAGLRVHGKPLIAMRAIVRAPRLSEVGCTAPIGGTRSAAVIADAHGDLPDARAEAIDVAHQFGVEPVVGAAATRTALFAATSADILHVAVHATIDLGGGAFAMHDHAVSALELVGRRTPALVVLSACSSATSDDNESATSLATAFLAGGSNQVIATLRPVTDDGSRELIRELYRDGISDPVRKLARVQAALARSANPDWPNFAVFGRDVCRKEPP